jgi:hypothetical protein
MFDSLTEQIKHDEADSAGVRALKWVAIAIVSVLAFGGLYYAIRLIE